MNLGDVVIPPLDPDPVRLEQHVSVTEPPRRLGLYTTKTTRPHWEADFQPGDYLLFGKETTGAPAEVHEWVAGTFGEEYRITLPMNPKARSLNLATVVSAAVYEGLRQLAVREVR
jgi:tRNA (cytidine/uridine-2'-O-)-methyltransferase